MTGSWYDSGFGGLANEQARLAAQYGPPRFWMPVGKGSKDIVFVDDEPFCIHEHNPKIDDSYQNWLTCIQGMNDDVVCCQKLGPASRYYIGYFTIVDTSLWTDKKGNEHQFELKLLGGKLPSLKKFDRKKSERVSLIGCMYKVSRDSDKDPNTGGEFDFNRQVDMDKLFGFACYKGKKLSDLWDEAEREADKLVALQKIFQVKPGADGKIPRILPSFNYMEQLKPLSPKELRLKLGAVEKPAPRKGAGPGNGAAGTNVDTDDVPF